MKADLFAYLTGQSNIAALIGSRIYPGIAPTSAALPYMTLTRTGDEQVYHLRGVSGMTDTSWQFDCWADDTVTLDRLTTAIRQAFDGLRRGRMVTTDVRSVTIENEIDGEEIPRDGSEEAIHRTTMLVRI